MSTHGDKNGPRRALLAVIKKEFKRFFSDRRMVVSTILLPCLMIYVLYSFMGAGISTMLSVDEDYKPTISAVNLPASIAALTAQANIDIERVQTSDVAGIEEAITDKTHDLLIIFPADFDEVIAAANIEVIQSTPGYTPPNVEVFYNSARTESQDSFYKITTLLGAYKDAQYTPYSINAPLPDATYDLATSQDSSGRMLSMMMPMILMMILFSGCMATAAESITGEKERGTIATLLVTPLKRWELALGKIVSVSCISVLAAASSFIGLILSLPKMMGDASSDAAAVLYGPLDYLFLLLIVISTVLLFVSLIALISAYAKTVKEASTYMAPLLIVVMLVGVLGMFGSAQTDPLFYLVPVYNSVQCMVGIFSFEYQILFVTITTLVNLLLVAVCIVVLTKMFNDENVMFAR